MYPRDEIIEQYSHMQKQQQQISRNKLNKKYLEHI